MRLRLLTYNIHRAIGIDGRFDLERIAEILRYHDADVVLLQEVDRGVPRSNHLDLAAALSRAVQYRYRAVGMNVTLKKGRYGNATLTRFPIGRQHNIDLTIGRRKRRGAQHARLYVPDGGTSIAVDVFNVHLGLSGAERRAQVERLLRAIGPPQAQAPAACIVAGDMNDWPGVLKRQFVRADFQCATNHEGSRWSIKSFPSYAPTSGLDKVFYRGPLRVLGAHRSRLKLARIASDHLPIIVDFELCRSGEVGVGARSAEQGATRTWQPVEENVAWASCPCFHGLEGRATPVRCSFSTG